MSPITPGGSSGGGAGSTGQNNQQEPDYKKLYEELSAKSEKLIDPKDYDVSQDNRYKGLMTKLQKEQEDHKAAEDTLKTLTVEHSAAQSEKEKATKASEDLQKQLDALTIEKDVLSVKTKRADMIMAQFPELAEFEAKGLIPETGPDEGEEELKKLLGTFQEQIFHVKTKAQEKFAEGGLSHSAGTGGSGGEVKATAKAELELANAAALAGKMADYSLHYNRYLELLNSQKS